jgi:hypothetical protein
MKCHLALLFLILFVTNSLLVFAQESSVYSIPEEDLKRIEAAAKLAKRAKDCIVKDLGLYAHYFIKFIEAERRRNWSDDQMKIIKNWMDEVIDQKSVPVPCTEEESNRLLKTLEEEVYRLEKATYLVPMPTERQKKIDEYIKIGERASACGFNVPPIYITKLIRKAGKEWKPEEIEDINIRFGLVEGAGYKDPSFSTCSKEEQILLNKEIDEKFTLVDLYGFGDELEKSEAKLQIQLIDSAGQPISGAAIAYDSTEGLLVERNNWAIEEGTGKFRINWRRKKSLHISLFGPESAEAAAASLSYTRGPIGYMEISEENHGEDLELLGPGKVSVRQTFGYQDITEMIPFQKEIIIKVEFPSAGKPMQDLFVDKIAAGIEELQKTKPKYNSYTDILNSPSAFKFIPQLIRIARTNQVQRDSIIEGLVNLSRVLYDSWEESSDGSRKEVSEEISANAKLLYDFAFEQLPINPYAVRIVEELDRLANPITTRLVQYLIAHPPKENEAKDWQHTFYRIRSSAKDLEPLLSSKNPVLVACATSR